MEKQSDSMFDLTHIMLDMGERMLIIPMIAATLALVFSSYLLLTSATQSSVGRGPATVEAYSR